MTCSKQGFATRKAVKLFFKRAKYLSGVCRPYYCDECDCFHYTSKSVDYVKRLRENVHRQKQMNKAS